MELVPCWKGRKKESDGRYSWRKQFADKRHTFCTYTLSRNHGRQSRGNPVHLSIRFFKMEKKKEKKHGQKNILCPEID